MLKKKNCLRYAGRLAPCRTSEPRRKCPGESLIAERREQRPRPVVSDVWLHGRVRRRPHGVKDFGDVPVPRPRYAHHDVDEVVLGAVEAFTPMRDEA